MPQFDVIKGIAIFMVVMGHVLTMCIRYIDQALAFKLIGQTHMPLFFFIAGYFSYRGERSPQVATLLGRRFVQLIVPMVVVGALWLWYFPYSGLQSPLDSTLQGALADEWKNGYWFPLVLFEITVIYQVAAPLLRLGRNAVGDIALTVIVSAVIGWIALGLLPADVVACGSLGLTATFLPVFMIGAMARKHAEGFKALYTNSWVALSAIVVGAVTVYMSMYYWEFELMASPAFELIVTVVWHLCLAVIAFAVITPWTDRTITNQPKVGTHPGASAMALWCLLGRESLGIYLLHYFFLFPMPMAQEPLRALGLGFVPTLAVAAVVAALIVAVTLAAIRIVKISRPLAMLLIGAKPS